MGLRSLALFCKVNIFYILSLQKPTLAQTWKQSFWICNSNNCRHNSHRKFSQEQHYCSKMETTLNIENNAPIHDVSLCYQKFMMVKNGGNGISKAFSDVVSVSAACLQNGGVIAVPTDTIYGVACLAQNTEAVGRIYEIKNRNFQNPVAISVGCIDDIYRWSKVTVAREVLCDLLPGPVTVVFERSPELNSALNPQTNLVGIRIPDHLFIQSLAKNCKTPIALTSANISGASSCLQVQEFENLWPKLDLVINGGKLSDTEESRAGSTVVDLSVPGKFRIIRPGSAHKATLDCLQEKHKLQAINSPQDR